MGCLGFGVLLAGLLLVSTDPPRTDLEQIQGWWRPTSLVCDGGDGVPAEALRAYVVRIQAQHVTEASEDGVPRSRSSFVLNPRRTPREIDLTAEDGHNPGGKLLGIYRVDGDMLTICHAFAGEPRPTEFTSKPGSRWILESFEREHPTRQVAERRTTRIAEIENQRREALRRARLANVKDARPRATLAGHRSTVWDLAFSPDGTLLASAGDGDDTVRLWDVASDKARAQFRPGLSGGYPLHIAFTPDGRTLAIGGLNLKEYDKADRGEPPRTVLRLWDTSSGKDRLLIVSRGDTPRIESLLYSGDGKTLVVNNGCPLYLWDVAGEKVRVQLDVPADTRISDFNTMNFTQAAISPDGRILAVGGLDHRVRLYELATGRPLASFRGHEKGVDSVAFSADGSWLASAGADKTVRIWPVTANPPRRSPVKPERILRHNDAISDVAFSADGTLLAAAGMNGVVTIYDGKTWALKTSFDTGQEYCSRCAFSPDGSLLATCGSPPEVRIWDVARLLNATPP